MEGRIDLVLFDLDDVLYHYSRRRRAARLSEITGIAPEVIRAAIWDSGLEAAGDRGAIAGRSGGRPISRPSASGSGVLSPWRSGSMRAAPRSRRTARCWRSPRGCAPRRASPS